ncbi:hypothetical protein EVAR_45827_1 [Eumeta japonica]|uniref:Uncharacterized protein n=1 Tax=Eumeta variegata TaxID=151549 RepID=A0A4C1WKL0_EUMVA|nr:hypothetical protein EVAR_45827_1 [Eumeta japonica]
MQRAKLSFVIVHFWQLEDKISICKDKCPQHTTKTRHHKAEETQLKVVVTVAVTVALTIHFQDVSYSVEVAVEAARRPRPPALFITPTPETAQIRFRVAENDRQLDLRVYKRRLWDSVIEVILRWDLPIPIRDAYFAYFFCVNTKQKRKPIQSRFTAQRAFRTPPHLPWLIGKFTEYKLGEIRPDLTQGERTAGGGRQLSTGGRRNGTTTSAGERPRPRRPPRGPQRGRLIKSPA